MCVIEMVAIVVYKVAEKSTRNKYPKMNKQIKKVGQATIDATCAVLGGIHFVSQSIADSVMHAEAKIRQSDTGEELESIKDARMLKTVEYQYKIVSNYERARDRIIKAKETVITKAFVSKTDMSLVPAQEYEFQPNFILVRAEEIE